MSMLATIWAMALETLGSDSTDVCMPHLIKMG